MSIEKTLSRIRTLWTKSNGEFQNFRDGVPLGFSQDGALLSLPLASLLVAGATGSGKSEVTTALNIGARRHLMAIGKGGCLQCFGIDPKRSEFAASQGLFKKVVFDPEDILVLLAELVEIMKSRRFRHYEITPEFPFILVLYDEFNTVEMSTDLTWKKKMRELLSLLLSQGRSSGIAVVAAVQQPQKEHLGPYRTHFVSRVALRLESAAETDAVLGADASKHGALSHLIEPATMSNHYATAGIGYVYSPMKGGFTRFRAPEITTDDIERWSITEK